jgi:hypothetical protein
MISCVRSPRAASRPMASISSCSPAWGSGERHHRMGAAGNSTSASSAPPPISPPATATYRGRRCRCSCIAGSGMVLSSSIRPGASRRRPICAASATAARPFLAAGNVWMRGILEEHHGVPHRDITWVIEREDAVAFTPPPGLRIETTTAGVRAEMLMLSGALDDPVARPAPVFHAGRQADGGCSPTASRRRLPISAPPASFRSCM